MRASTRARTHTATHTQIQAQHADESARGEIEPFLARTHTHRTYRARARTHFKTYAHAHSRTCRHSQAPTAQVRVLTCACAWSVRVHSLGTRHTNKRTASRARARSHTHSHTRARAGRYDARRLRPRPLSAAPRPRKIRASPSAPTSLLPLRVDGRPSYTIQCLHLGDLVQRCLGKNLTRCVDGARAAATARTATSYGRWHCTARAASIGNGAVDGSWSAGAAAAYQRGDRSWHKADSDTSRSQHNGIDAGVCGWVCACPSGCQCVGERLGASVCQSVCACTQFG